MITRPGGWRRPIRGAAAAAASAALTACAGAQSALDPQGPVAGEILNLWWVLLAVCGAAFALILSLLLYAVYRHHDRRRPIRGRLFVIGGGLVFPAVSLIGLLVYATEIGRRMLAEPESPALQVVVTGHQWWWEVHYPAAAGAPPVTTANEIHVPVGVAIEVSLRSHDVIHSFWIPKLAGKVDLVPGRTNSIRFEADRAGEIRGQCAEYCGAQHARMALRVVAQSPAQFAAWREATAADARVPAEQDETAFAGFQAFIDNGCAQCHSVRGAIPGSGSGEPASGVRGPDLTHVAARSALGGRTLPYSRENLARWIRDNDRLKPGNRMPAFDTLPDETVDAIAVYLDTLR